MRPEGGTGTGLGLGLAAITGRSTAVYAVAAQYRSLLVRVAVTKTGTSTTSAGTVMDENAGSRDRAGVPRMHDAVDSVAVPATESMAVTLNAMFASELK